MHQGAPTTMAYPSLPASPTLTNPDMILPYGDYDSTPSPPRSKAWANRQEDMDFAQPLSYGTNSLGSVPLTPITPIIYGNGTMLSDIGEVTEAESTLGVGIRRTRNRIAKGGDSPVKSSPTVGHQNTTKRSKVGTHQRSASMESTSTITTESQAAEAFEDFDDTVSVDESAFQGDDEESVVDESYGKPMLAEVKTMYRREVRGVDSRREKEDEELSSAALSRRAEIILSNAKKRLDNMEGNLSRARSSLYISPSSSMASIHSSSPLSRSTPSPPQPRIVPQMGMPPARHRQLNHSTLGPNNATHARIGSENSLPLSPSNTHNTTIVANTVQPLIPSPQFQGQAWRDSYEAQKSAQNSPRPSLNDHSGLRSAIVIMETGSDGQISPFESDRFVRCSTAEPHARHEIDPRALTRSASSMQMRDLTDKMKDLKGKISTLRDRAKEDNMKRRSVQNLRTPSPFTAAEQWYTTSKDYKDGHLSANAVVMHSPWNEDIEEQETEQEQLNNTHDDVPEVITEEITEYIAEDSVEYQESETTSIYQDFEAAEPHSEEYGNVLGSFDEDDPRNDGVVYEEPAEMGDGLEEEHANGEEHGEEQVINDGDHAELIEEEQFHSVYDDSEDDASLYHDTSQVPISHEDREDAFDYEHFFLHSAMGTMSQQRYRRRGSSGSYTSEDSVETTRGLEAPTGTYKDELIPVSTGHKRQKSIDTVSTMATFATAKEGQTDEDGHSQYHEYAVQNINHSQQLEDEDTPLSPSVIPEGTPVDDARDLEQNPRRGSVIRGGVLQPVAIHRPSVSSLASTSSGTTRAFPLVNKPKNASGTSTPSGSINPTPYNLNSGELLGMALTTGTANNVDGSEYERATQPSPVSMLHRDDQILVERLVANVGKCVVGLQETKRGGAENRIWRKRLEIAYRILGGEDSLLKEKQ